jgi:glycogen synthase
MTTKDKLSARQSRVDPGVTALRSAAEERYMDPARNDLPSDRRIKVLFVPAWYPDRYNERSGVSGTFCREHARAAALYDDVAVLSFTSRPQRWPTLRCEQVEDAGVPTFYASYGCSPIPKTTFPFFRLQLRRALQRVMEEWGRPDVIHTQDSYAYYVMKATQHLSIPCVMSQHWTGFLRGVVTNSAIRRFKWAFSRAVRVMPANKFALRDYEKYGLQAPMTWLPNTVNTSLFRPPSEGGREPWLLHASGFTPQKRFPDIVRGFAQLLRKRPDAVLQVAGHGPNRADMEALASRELPRGSFHFHGFALKEELAELMRRSSGFILPSDAENLPCVLMEAMACACPVLTTRVGGITALVQDGQALFVDVGNTEQIAEAMCRLLDGTHGLDMIGISRDTRSRFSHVAVGQLLHEEHLKAAENLSRGGNS